MEDREDSPMFLEDAGASQTLLVYCGGEEEALNNPSPGPLHDPREEMVWVMGGAGGDEEGVLLPDELGGETLLLLGDHLSLLPNSPDLTPQPQVSAEQMPNNNNSNSISSIRISTSKKAATHTHASTTRTQGTYTNPKLTYTDAHGKSTATLKTYTNPKLMHTNTDRNPAVTTTTTASAPKAYTSIHTESTQPRTYTNTRKSTYTNTQQQKASTQEREASTLIQTHMFSHTQIQPQAPSPLTQTQTHTQTDTLVKTHPPATLPHPHTHPSPITKLSALRAKLVSGCKSSLDEDELSEEPFVGPSLRWAAQTPKSYRGAKLRDTPLPPRKIVRKVPQRADTDGETSGMGSSVDEPVESSTESASEAPSTPPAFIQPRPSASRGPSSTSPTAMKKRRGGWPKGRKRKPELPGAKPPKAPLTAYVLFLNERRKYYRETRPELSFGAVTKVLGAEWSAMSVEQKAAYVSRSEQDKRRYRNELQAYRQSHDYQLLLRKKRIKNVIRRGGTTTEESSDFTDEIDDDDSEELYCRICDQLFTSLHNKREHLYGKTHLQAITGEYQRERLAEEERQMAAALRVGQGAGDCLTCGSPLTPHTQHLAPARKGVDSLLVGCPSCSPSPARPQSPCTPQEDDHDGDKEDEEEEEEEEEEEDGQDEGGVSSSPPSPLPSPSESISEALEGVMAKVMEREEEIHALRRSSGAAAAAKEELSATLSCLQARGRRLGAARQALDRRNAELKAAAEVLWQLPALFGVTPLQMVEATTLISQEQQDNAELQEDNADIQEQVEELQQQEEEDLLCQEEEQEEELVLQDEGIHLEQQDMEDVPQVEPKSVERLLVQGQEPVLHSEGLGSDRDVMQQKQQQQHQQQVQNEALLQKLFLSQGEHFHQQQQQSEKVQFLQPQPQQQQWQQQLQHPQQQEEEQQKLQLHQEKLQRQEVIYVEDLRFIHHHCQQQGQQEEIGIEIQEGEIMQSQLLQQQQLGGIQIDEKEGEAEEVVISEEELHLLGQQLQPLQLGNQQQGEPSDTLHIFEQPVLKEVQHPQQFILNDQQIQLLPQPQQQLLIIHGNGEIQTQLPQPPPPPPPPIQRQPRQQPQILLLEGEVDSMYLRQQEENVPKETERESRKRTVKRQEQQQQKRHIVITSSQHMTTTQPHTCKLKGNDLQQEEGEISCHKKTEGLAKHTFTQNSQSRQIQTLKQQDVKRKTRVQKNVQQKQEQLEPQQQQFIQQNVQQITPQHLQALSNSQQQRGRQAKQQKVTFVQQTDKTAGEQQKIQKTLPHSRTIKRPEKGLLEENVISIQHQDQTQLASSLNDEEVFEPTFSSQAFQERLELDLLEDLGLQEEEDLLQQDLFNLQHEEGELGARDLILLDNT